MTVLQEILKWSKELPLWQSDVIARLLTSPVITTDKMEEVYTLLKSSHGITDESKLKPNPLRDDQIPAPTNNKEAVTLRSIHSLINVNALAEEQTLTFQENGVTVIYGDNGSGKSGYSRLLKRACRARDQEEAILPNFNKSPQTDDKAQGAFDITVNGKTDTIHWVDGQPPPEILSSLSIFDSRCARAYLDQEDDFSYIPYGLEIFEGLAKTCGQLEVMVKRDIAAITPDLDAFTALIEDTLVGKLINNLSRKTTEEEITALSSLSEVEIDRHKSLHEILKDENPLEKIKILEAKIARIKTISERIISKSSTVDHAVIKKICELSDKYRSSKEVAKIAKKEFNESEKLLLGTGGDAWREMFEAARKFSLESHPDHSFPDLGADSPCPLCQQPLESGSERLKRFERYILQEAEKTMQENRVLLNVEYQEIINLNMDLNLDEVTIKEISDINIKLAENIVAFQETLNTRQQLIKEGIEKNIWGGLEAKISTPNDDIQTLIEKLTQDVDTLKKAANDKARQLLLNEFKELEARIKLSQVKESVVSAVNKLGHQHKLNLCLKDLNTNPISRKASEIAQSVISVDLANALNTEFEALGVSNLKIAAKTRTVKGKSLHKLKLEFTQNHPTKSILSEGEQRAIAIGAFLAEVNLSENKGGIVFDDPVSSLDHTRRESVAKRLITEAAQRQVVILTHDIYFACILLEEAKLNKTPISTFSVNETKEGFGVPYTDLPFEGQSTKKRIGSLKEMHQKIDKFYRDSETQNYKTWTTEAYRRLRITWERAVEEVLFRNVVLRFRKSIETTRLKGVKVEDTDYHEIDAGMTRCSNFAPHDRALLAGISTPKPDELLKDISALESWRDRIEGRSKEIEKERKSQ